VRLALALLLAVHGAIHLLGFVKGFGLAPVAQLKEPINSPPTRCAGSLVTCHPRHYQQSENVSPGCRRWTSIN
jgi:hypothetical protein